jgi:two-component system, LytTR family, sensor kinase
MELSRAEPRRVEANGLRRSALGLLGLLIASVLVGLFSATQNYYVDRAEGEAVTWGGTLGSQLTFWITWGAFLPSIVLLTRRIGRARSVPAQVGLYVVLGLVISVLNSAIVFGIRSNLLGGTLQPPSFVLYARGWLTFDLAIYAGLVAGTLAVEHWRRGRAHELQAAQLGLALSRAQWRALQMQLRPHFLFNTLNTVAMLIRTGDSQRALTMIAGLGDLLRQILDDGAQQEVPLREELEFLERYLGIERVRFSDRLNVHVHADPVSLESYVPRFLLQPLVENAIRHGIEKRTGSGALSITAKRVDGALSVAIQDDGAGPPIEPSKGVGLTNARQRLRYLYGDNADLSLMPVAGGGAIATVSLPWHDRPLDGDGG